MTSAAAGAARAADKGRRSEAWYVAITDFPRGLGSTARALSICQALGIAGYDVRLLLPYALGHGRNDSAAGIAQNVAFEYLNGSTTRPSNALGVMFAKLRGNLTLLRRMARDRSRLAVVVCTTRLSWMPGAS